MEGDETILMPGRSYILFYLKLIFIKILIIQHNDILVNLIFE